MGRGKIQNADCQRFTRLVEHEVSSQVRKLGMEWQRLEIRYEENREAENDNFSSI